jgi:hypothetical protein
MRCRLSAAEPMRDWAPADCRATEVWARWTLSLTLTMSISRRSVSIFWSVEAMAVRRRASACFMFSICGPRVPISVSSSAMRPATSRARSVLPWPQSGAGRAFVFGDLLAEAGQFVLGHPAARHQTGQVVAGLALGVVGVADFLIEDLQRIGVDHRLAGLMGRAAEQGGEFGEHGHQV